MNCNKKICLYTGSKKTKEALCRQLYAVFGKNVEVIAYAIDEEAAEYDAADLVLLSSTSIYDDFKQDGFINGLKSYFICGRSLNFDDIENVLGIAKGKKVLFVNDTKETAELCIQNLINIGITHLEYIPCYPNNIPKGSYDTAITAGEEHLVPDGVKNIIDLGPRAIDLASLLKIADMLEMRDFNADIIISPYTNKIIDISKKMAIMNTEAEVLKNILRQKLESKGHTAMYTFEDILGVSTSLAEVKHKAKKLAITDLSVLIEGESGTGKELFASAIHNASQRKNGPYLAVNFSALPAELIESELFGYEEGAFTGAKKGGKIGLFEQADGGTIFLDEIGDIPASVQAKLLRVLQEKEVMPIGGSNIKKVDIRIVAATNKDLLELVRNGEFRADLYYRLKIGYVYVPPLRRRKEDLQCMVEHFIKLEGSEGISVKEDVYTTFYNYYWYGNIRELKNTVKYMLAVRENEAMITKNDLPDESFFEEKNVDFKEHKGIETFMGVTLEYDLQTVLFAIYELCKEGKNAGRKPISERLKLQQKNFSENQVRNRVEVLKQKGLVKVYKGKRGTCLTEEGWRLAESNIKAHAKW